MKVLFIGNSHTYMNDMPYLFSEMMKLTTGNETESVMLAYSGRDLSWHRKEYFSVRYQLMYGRFDYCVIQQAAHPFPPEEDTIRSGKELIGLCRTCGVTPVLFMTWAEKAYPDHQTAMFLTYRKLAEQTGALLAPVGEIWQKVRDRFPEIELYYKDGEHASVMGDFLTAAVIVSVLADTADIAVPDRVPDYGVCFDDPSRPEALTDYDSIMQETDQETAGKILSCIREEGE